MENKLEDLTLQELFVKATGLTWDIQTLIDACGNDAEAKKTLLKKIVWMIPDGAAADNFDRSLIESKSGKKSPRIQLVEVLTEALGLSEDFSEVFVDFNDDRDVDAYDAVTVDDSTDSTDSGSTGSDLL